VEKGQKEEVKGRREEERKGVHEKERRVRERSPLIFEHGDAYSCNS